MSTKAIPKYQRNYPEDPIPKIKDTQLPYQLNEILLDSVKEYEGNIDVQEVNKIPDTNNIPLHTSVWLKIKDVVCIYVDMKNSTVLSASHHPRGTSKTYQLFTGTAVQLFHEMDASYIDIKGDGVFALYNSNEVYKALAAAVTFKTFSDQVIIPTIRKRTKKEEIGTHIGIDQKDVLVKRIGFKRVGHRTDRQNEVWAGKPVNMAAKLASLTEHGELLVSDRYYQRIRDEHVRLSCGCDTKGIMLGKKPLWTPIVLNDPKFDFDTAWKLGSKWCPVHGKEFCNKILSLNES